VAATLVELLPVRTAEDEEASLVSVLKTEGFPVTDWEAGGVAQTMVKAIGARFGDVTELVASVAAGNHTRLAIPLDPTWLDLLGEHFFALERARATYTKQLIRVSCEPGFGPQDINKGFRVRGPKNIYEYQGPAAVTVADGGYSDIEMRAESPGSAFDDPANTVNVSVTPLPGVSVNNPPTQFGGLGGTAARRNPANAGSGSITPSAPIGFPVQPRRYIVTVTASGSQPSTGAVVIKYEQNGLTTNVATLSPIPATYAGLGDGITLTFANGVGVGFIKGDIHTFESIGSPITANGVDDETNESYAARMLGRWPSLSLNIVADKYVAWIRQASLDGAFGIEKISTRPSVTVAGQTDVLVATATGAPSGGIVSALQTYVNARDGITDTALVTAAANVNITPSGSVTVRLDELDAAQTAADESWLKYIEDLPIGGDLSTGSPGVVRLSELVQALMDAGAIDYTGLQLNGFAVNRALNTNEVAVIPAGALPSSALTWVTVA
jgi:hypothetical protein